MKKRLGSVLLTLAMLLTLIPWSAVPARAAVGTAATKVHIAGVNQELSLGSSVSNKYFFRQEGSVSLLELCADVAGDMYNFNSKYYAAIWADGDLTIRLSASNISVCGTPGDSPTRAYGIYVVGNLTIENYASASSLLVRSGADESSQSVSYSSVGIHSDGSLTFQDHLSGASSMLTVRAYGGATGIDALREVYINGAAVEAYAGTIGFGDSCGLHAGKLLLLKEVGSGNGRHVASLTARGGTITKNSDPLTSIGVDAAGGIAMESGVIDAAGGTVLNSTRGRSYGISLATSCSIGGGSVTARGGACTECSCGIYQGAGTLTVSGGQLTLSSLGDESNRAQSRYGFMGSTLNLMGSAAVDAQSGPVCGSRADSVYGVYLSGNLNCYANSSLHAEGKNAYSGYSYGLYVNRLTVNGSAAVTAIGGDMSYRSAHSIGASVYTLNMNGGTLNATSGNVVPTVNDTAYSYGMELRGTSVSITGGTISAHAGKAGTSSYSCGVYLSSTSDSVVDLAPTGGMLTASGYKNAIRAYNGGDYTASAPIIRGGTSRDGSNAVTAAIFDKNWKYAELDARSAAVVAITEGAALTKSLGDGDFTLHPTVTGTSGGTWTWSSSSPSVATVTSSGKVHILGVGTTAVTVRYEDASHVGSATLVLTVYGAKPVVTVNGANLHWSAMLPAGGRSALAIAAWYDASGRMRGATASEAFAASGAVSGDLTVGTGVGYSYRLMIVDAVTYAPLCEAWAI